MADDSKAGLTDSLVIEANVDTIKGVLQDFESYPEWMSNVLSMEVLERDKKKRGTKVRYRVDVILRKIEYVLSYTYRDKENRIDLNYVEGDLDDVNSYYEFEPLDDSRTQVTYHYYVKYSIPRALRLPAKGLLKQVDKLVMKSALKDLKKRVESL
jgi:ribosome-associated toxin RatA of RatAB toxin-antitoxin module